MGSRTIRTSSSTTNTSKATTTVRYNSRTTTTVRYNSRTTRESSADNCNAALQARLEEERQKRIKENKEYIAEIQATNAEVKNTRDMIAQAQKLLANAVGGEKYKEYSRYLINQDKMLQQITNGLNSCGEKAATNIREDGEVYTFNQINTNPDKNNTNNNKNTLSVNTDELRNLEILLDNISKNTKNINSRMPEISNTSAKLGITNSGEIQENSQDLVRNTTELKNKLTQQIQDTEKTEKENLNIVGRIADWFENLFKKSDKEQNSQTITRTTSTRTTTRTTTSTTRTTRTTTRTPITNLTRTRTMNINSAELKAMDEILKLAKQYGIPTSGKSQREILKALAIKLGINLSADSSQKNSRFWRYSMD